MPPRLGMRAKIHLFTVWLSGIYPLSTTRNIRGPLILRGRRPMFSKRSSLAVD
jgi:hypothetical protein